MLKVIPFQITICFLFLVYPAFLMGGDLKNGTVDQDVMRTVFSDTEKMHYSISWTGGIKIGDLDLVLRKEKESGFVIHARVTDYGLFRLFYPVDDIFTTFVRGGEKLPYRYEVLQREGRGSVTRRLSLYDQDSLVVKYTRDDEEEQVFPVEDTVHNEFSSFYITRSMVLKPDDSFMVPTFADKKRNEVKVHVKKREEIDTVLGRVSTVAVMPLMKFKGLYDKDGDTVIWFTDDACRVPVKINSKILIGSLTAELKSFSNPACKMY